MNESIHWSKLGAPAIFLDYLYHFHRVQDLYPASPFEPETWLHVLENRFNASRHLHNGAISAYLQPWCKEKERQIGDFELLWVTGQQPGILGGPLFTLFKILTALRLAHENPVKDFRFKAAFWSLAEDHDLVEALSVATPEDSGPSWTPIDKSLHENRLPLFRIKTRDRTVQEAVDFHRNRLNRGMYLQEVETRILECYGRDRDLSLPDAFRCYLHLFDICNATLLYVPANESAVKEQAMDLILQVARSWPDLYEGWLNHNQQMKARGYHLQVEPYEGYFPLFRLTPDGRHRIVWDGHRFRVPGTGESWDLATFLKWLEKHVGEISPNVILRPLIQDTVLPTAGYIAGPAEIAYFAQLSFFYRALKIPMPLVIPRISATLMTPAMRRWLKKMNISAVEILHKGEDALLDGMEEPGLWRDRVEVVKRAVGTLEQDTTSLLGSSAKHPRIRKSFRAIKRWIDELEKAGTDMLREQRIVSDERWHRILTWLRPGGHLQERVYHPGVFYAVVGPGLHQALMQLPLMKPDHHLVSLT